VFKGNRSFIKVRSEEKQVVGSNDNAIRKIEEGARITYDCITVSFASIQDIPDDL
jgi:hypothetical protein